MNKFTLTTLFAGFLSLTASAQTTIRCTVGTTMKQKITGFGAASLENLMRPTSDGTITGKAFDPAGPIGLNILRVEMSPNTKGDVTAADVGWDTPYDWHGSLPDVKAAKKHGAIVFATPWSPPPSLKTNGSAVGGNADDQGNVRATCKAPDKLFIWFNNYLKYMRDNGAPVDYVSFQNEPDWWVSYSGCLYTPQEMYDVIKQYHSKLNKATFNAKFIAGEPLGFNTDYYHRLLNDPEVNEFCDVLAGHVYGSYDCKKNIATLRKWAPDKEIWMTEHWVENGVNNGRAIPTWDKNLEFTQDVDQCLINGCTAYIYWYLCKDNSFIYDGNKYDNATCVGAEGLQRGDILPRGYLMGQFAHNLIGATQVSNTRSISDTSGTPGVNTNFEISTYVKGDSIIVNAINTKTLAYNFEITLPKVANGVKVIASTEGNLCAESTPEFEASDKLTYKVPAKSFCTFIFDCSGANAIESVSAEVPTTTTNGKFYNISGQSVANPRKGIFIRNGKKVLF